MKKPFLQEILIVVCIFLFLSLTNAQEYLVHTYSVDDGLSNSVVYDMAQEPNGRMCFTTRSGLSIYDGINWYNIKNDWQVIYKGFIRIDITNDGCVWLTQRHLRDGLWKYSGKDFESVKIPGQYIGKNDKATVISDIKVFFSNGDTVLAVSTLNNGLLLRVNSKWNHYNDENSIVGDKVYSLTKYKNKLYIVHDNGISLFDEGKLRKAFTEQFSFPSNPVYALAFEHDRNNQNDIIRIWFVGQGWFGKIEDNRLKIHNYKFDLPAHAKDLYSPHATLLPDLSGGLIFGNSGNLFHYNGSNAKVNPLGIKNGLNSEGSSSLLMDREHNIWIANYRGISKIPSLAWITYREDHGLLEDEVSAILEHSEGKIVFGHNLGLTFYDEKYTHTISFNQDAVRAPYLSRILSMTNDDKGNIWIAANTYGLAFLQDIHKINWVYSTKNNLVLSVFYDRQKKLWVSTLSGTGKIDNNKFHFLDEKDAVQCKARSVSEGSDGALYFATISSGVSCYKDNKWSHFRSSQEKYNQVFSVLPGFTDNVTLAGTSGGVCRIAGDSLKAYRDLFSINASVFFIKKDSRDNTWIGTDNGIYIWNGKILRHITTHQGLAGIEINRSAFLEDSKGRIWIGTNKGVSCYRREYDHWQYSQPELSINSVSAGGKSIELVRGDEISLDDNNLSFRFSLISFRDEYNNNIRYRLNGYDNSYQWIYKVRKNSIFYPNLPPGRYQLTIQARNVDGVFGDPVSSGWFVIKRPFWQGWWFVLMVVLAVTGALYLLINLRSRKKYAERLQNQINIRTRQLRASEEKYRTIFEQSQDVVVISSEDDKILDINPAGIKLFGFQSREEIENTIISVELYVNSEDRYKFQELIRKHGFVHDYELHLKNKQGQPITVLLSSSLNYDENREMNVYLGIMKNVTERWQMKEKLAQGQKMESIGMLAGGIAHDFNNILGGILGYASLLKLKVNENNSIYKYVDSIERSAIRGAELTNQLLVFARRGEAKLKPVSMNDIVKEGMKILKSTFPKNIELRINYGKNVPLLYADESQIHQIMINLCVNARDAIEGRGIIAINTKRIYIDSEVAKVYTDGSEGLFVALEVIDNGMGMDQQVVQRIFEPFYTTKEQGKGTGLGLSMIYGFVKSHKGFLDVESSPGKGSVFRVFLPATDETSIQQKKGLLLKTDTGKEHILVVDDEYVLRDFLKHALQGYGYVVSLAENGEQAVEIFKSKKDKIDLIILDMIMPKMDGEQALKQIRELNENVPVIITSGYSDKKKLETVSQMKIAGIIHKPFRIDKLLTQIRTILDNQ